MSALDGLATGAATSAETAQPAPTGANESGQATGTAAAGALPVDGVLPAEDSGAEAAAAASGTDGAEAAASSADGTGPAPRGADRAEPAARGADGAEASGAAGASGTDGVEPAVETAPDSGPSGGDEASEPAGETGGGIPDFAPPSGAAEPERPADSAGETGGGIPDFAPPSGAAEPEPPADSAGETGGGIPDIQPGGGGPDVGGPDPGGPDAGGVARAVDAPETDPGPTATAAVESEVDSAPAAVLAAPAADPVGPAADPAGDRPRAVPALGPVPRAKQPASDERVLASGLRVIAIRRPGVPLVELRLRVPFGGTVRTLPARSAVLGETMLSGTERRSQVELAAALQAIGADLHVSVDSDRLLLGGAVLRGGLPQLLELLAEVLTAAAYPNREVGGERGRLIERLSIARSQPAVLVREALRRRLFGDHPYARELPSVAEVAAVTPPQVRRLHTERVTPAGAVLVAVGDVTPARALDQIEAALTGWRAGLPTKGLPALPAVEPGPTLVVDRPGSVQSSIRLAGPALPRDHADYPALQLANLVFGGYFSSRLVENIREDKGYTYGPHSRIDHGSVGSTLVVDADVSTDVTAPALLETRYELGRMSTLPVSESELADVRQYAIGTLALSLASQSGLASTLAALAGSDLGLTWLREHPQRLAEVSVDDIARVSRQFLAPGGLVTVILGDAAKIDGPLSTLGPVQTAPAEEADRS
jgi:zinc protease